ncbi:MAG: ribose-phosphate diphosphokinase [Anaerolineae bacterium]
MSEHLANRCRLFSGQAHRALACELSAYLGIPLSPSETRRFSNDNLFVQLQDSVREKDVYIVQPLSPPANEHLLELLLMCDAARGASARRITAVIPYFSYARSDKKDEPRISIAARLIADLLVTAGVNHVIAMTLHSPQVHGFFSVPMDHLSDQPIFIEYLRQKDLSSAVLVAPDMGRAKQTSKLARQLGIPMAAVSKQRIDDARVHVDSMIGEVRGMDAIIYDDEVATAGTMEGTAQLLYARGARSITLVCAHGLFTGPAIQRLQNLDLKEIITTNTVPIPEEKRLPNMTILSVAPAFGETIRRNVEGGSVQPLFSY